MRRTKALLSCLLALALVMLTACGARQQTVHRLSADRVTQAATVSQLQEVSDLIVVFTPETQENVLSRYSDGKEKLLWNSGGGSLSDCGVTRWNFGLVRMEKEKIEIRQNDNHKNRKYLSVVCIPCIASTSVCRDLERGFQDGMGSGRSLVWRSFRGDGGSGWHQQHGILFFCLSQ